MADINLLAVTDLTGTTTTSTTYVDVTGAILAKESMTALKRYLVMVQFTTDHSTAVDNMSLRMVSGTTPTLMPGSEIIALNHQTVGRFYCFGWLHEFTQPATSEDLQLQWKVSAGTGTIKSINMLAIEVDDLAAAGHYYYGEDDDTGAPTQLTTTPVDFATLTFTPNGTDDWLVLAGFTTLSNATPNTSVAAVLRHGADVQPAALWEQDVSGDTATHILTRVYPALAASSQQFDCSAEEDGGARTHDHKYTAIAAINLNAFVDHSSSWVAGAHSFAVNNTPEILTESADSGADITPTTTGNFVAIYGGISPVGGFDVNRLWVTMETVDESGFKGAYVHDIADDQPMSGSGLRSLSSGSSRVIDLVGQAQDVTNSPNIEQRSLACFSVALTAGPTGRIMSSMAGYGGLAGPGGIAGPHGGIAG